MQTSITIPKPCPANWNNMQGVEGGKFCNSCEKTVHDLSELSDEELIAFLHLNGKNICGKFSTEQLDEPQVKRFSFFNSFSLKAASIAALLVTRLFSPTSAKAQDMKYNYPVCPKTDGMNTTNTVNVNTEVHLITGKVVDHKTGEPLEYARVYIIVGDSTIESTRTDSLGNFTLSAGVNNSSTKIDLVIKKRGYKADNFKNYTPDGQALIARLRVDKHYHYMLGCPSF